MKPDISKALDILDDAGLRTFKDIINRALELPVLREPSARVPTSKAPVCQGKRWSNVSSKRYWGIGPGGRAIVSACLALPCSLISRIVSSFRAHGKRLQQGCAKSHRTETRAFTARHAILDTTNSLQRLDIHVWSLHCDLLAVARLPSH
jgi:hypothetical protein